MLHFDSNAGLRLPRGLNLPAPRSGMVQTAIGPVDVCETGPDDGDAIILVTHGLGSIESFEEIAMGLAGRLPGRRIVTYSRPGCGRTPALSGIAPEMLLFREASVVLPALMQALAIGKADFVGHGDGAAIVLLAASLRPDLAGRLLALAPQVFADEAFIRMTRNLPREEWRSGLCRQLGAAHADGEAAYRRWLDAREALCQAPDALLDHIDGVRAPVLFVQGLRDEFGSGMQVSLPASRVAGPVKWVLLQRDGHFPQHENPEQILALIETHFGGGMPLPVARRTAPPVLSFA